MMLKRNVGLAGWLEQQRDNYEGRACEILEAKASPSFDGYINKCECKIGKF